MRIGIDIDDTITDSWECLIPYYSRMFDVPESILKKSKPYYRAIEDKITLDEYFELLLPVHDEIIPKVNIKENVKETIDKLYELGHKVIFITSRGKGHTDPYTVSKDFLDKHHIKYEKLIINAGDKAKVCKEENISLFIDDSFKHCSSVSKIGIDVLMPETYYNKEYKEFKHFKDWNEVYNYVRRCYDGKQ